MASYNVKHTITNETGGREMLMSGPLPKAQAEHLLFLLAQQHNYRGGTVELSRPVSRRSRVTLPKKVRK